MLFEKYVLKIYCHVAMERCDDEGTMYYFSPKDFPGLEVKEYPFMASAGHRLQGWIYSYEAYDPKRIIVFEHGMGDGHRPYFKEIEMLCRCGFRVFTYDHTGCMASGGESTNGFTQSLCDLNDCISTIKQDEQFKGKDISVVGHSWGGYSAMNIVALHPEISHVVAMCGFVSVKELFDSYTGKYLKSYSELLLDCERKLNPNYVDYSAVESISNTDAKVLLIYSDNDKKCKSVHYRLLESVVSTKNHVQLRMVHNKGHKPTYTQRAVEELERYAQKRRRRKRIKLLETPQQKASFLQKFDWNTMTEQDTEIWKMIDVFLKN